MSSLRIAAVLIAGAGFARAADGPPDYVPRAIPFPARASYATAGGAIAITGYNDMKDLLERIDARFAAAHPGFRFALDLPGTRAGPPALARGASAFAPMGAEFTAEQLRAYRQAAGADLVAFRVAHAAVSPRARSGPLLVVVHPDNPLDRLTVGALARIFSTAGRGDEFARWGQAGLEGAWTERKIHPCGLDARTPLGESLLREKMPGRVFRPQFRAFVQSEDVVRAVARDPLAIGFARANVVRPGVRVVALAETPAGPYSRGSAEDVMAGRYPLDRFLYIYARPGPSGRLDPFVAEYLRLVLSRDGQAAVAETAQGYLPLNAAELSGERARLEALAGD